MEECTDVNGSFPIDSVNWIQTEKTCSWASQEGKPWRCSIVEVTNNCPASCNVLCESGLASSLAPSSNNDSSSVNFGSLSVPRFMVEIIAVVIIVIVVVFLSTYRTGYNDRYSRRKQRKQKRPSCAETGSKARVSVFPKKED